MELRSDREVPAEELSGRPLSKLREAGEAPSPPGLAARSGKKDVDLDSFIVSATPYEELRRRYDDGTWDRERFAAAYILFPERNEGYDYIAAIIANRDPEGGG